MFFSTITDVFPNQKRINVYECTAKMALHDSFKYEPLGKENEEGRSGGKIE
jgi:hypothetical protein